MITAATGSAAWRILRGIDPGALSAARMQAHQGVQWLARWAYAYISPLPDDEHSNLGWDDIFDGFTTRPLPGDVRLGLNLTRFELAHLSPKARESLPLDGRSNADVRLWFGQLVAADGFSGERIDRALPYTISDHAIASGAPYAVSHLGDTLRELTTWYANAARSLAPIHDRMRGRGLAASEVRCWPHHFDLATLVSFPMARGETGYVGVGLSPGDHYYDEPYFYVSVYPRPDPASLPTLPKLGHWHIADFTAGVVVAHRILASANRQAETEEFLNAAVDAAVAILR